LTHNHYSSSFNPAEKSRPNSVVSEVSQKPPYQYFARVVRINMISKPGGLLGVNGARFSAEIDAELFNRAEKELAAFVAAANTLHGEEQARAAADDWLLELIALEEHCKDACLDLRSVTIGAARRLARRLSIPSPAHAALAVVAGILLLIAPANAQAADSNSRHPLTQDKLVLVSVKHESSKIPTVRAKTRTIRYPRCSLLTVVSKTEESISVRTNSTQEENAMEAIGLLVTLEARPGKEADAEAFLKSAQPLALDEKGTLKW
jgi:hypothetical protein